MEEKEASLRQEYEDLQKQLQDPSIFSDPSYPKIARRQSQLEGLLDLFDRRAQALSAQAQAQAMDVSGDPELTEMVATELRDLKVVLAELDADLQHEMDGAIVHRHRERIAIPPL